MRWRAAKAVSSMKLSYALKWKEVEGVRRWKEPRAGTRCKLVRLPLPSRCGLAPRDCMNFPLHTLAKVEDLHQQAEYLHPLEVDGPRLPEVAACLGVEDSVPYHPYLEMTVAGFLLLPMIQLAVMIAVWMRGLVDIARSPHPLLGPPPPKISPHQARGGENENDVVMTSLAAWKATLERRVVRTSPSLHLAPTVGGRRVILVPMHGTIVSAADLAII